MLDILYLPHFSRYSLYSRNISLLILRPCAYIISFFISLIYFSIVCILFSFLISTLLKYSIDSVFIILFSVSSVFSAPPVPLNTVFFKLLFSKYSRFPFFPIFPFSLHLLTHLIPDCAHIMLIYSLIHI